MSGSSFRPYPLKEGTINDTSTSVLPKPIRVKSNNQVNKKELQTLEMLIPPLENFEGPNNPLSFQYKGACPKKSDDIGSDPNNNKGVKNKKVSVIGKINTQNGNTEYLTESQMSADDKESLLVKNDYIKVEMNTEVVDETTEVDTYIRLSAKTFVEKLDHSRVQINTQVLDEIVPVNDVASVYLDSATAQVNSKVTNEGMLSGDIKTENDEEGLNNENDQFLCDHCPNIFTSNDRFTNHMKIHCGESLEKQKERRTGRRHVEKLLCESCPNTFISEESLKKHMKTHKTENETGPFMCDKCPTRWHFLENLKYHQRIHTPNFEGVNMDEKEINDAPQNEPSEEKYAENASFKDEKPDDSLKGDNCDQCSYKTNNKSYLKKHVKNVHGGTTYYCNECEYRSKWKKSLANHVAVVHEGKRYECEMCDYKITSKESLKTHIKAVHHGIKFDCDLCEYSSTRKNHLNAHVNTVHQGKERSYECNYCEYKANHKSHLVQHTRSVHEGITFNCEQCNYQSKWKKNIKDHVASVHQGIRYDCQLCKFRSAKKANLNQHVKSVHEKVTYDCGECDYKGKYKQNLADHIASVHRGIKYDCELCDYTTPKRNDLKKHVASLHA